jgi:hypothetical protein
LRQIRLPHFTEKTRKHASRLADSFLSNPTRESTLASLDQLVAESFGLNPNHVRAIAAMLAESNARSLPRSVETIKVVDSNPDVTTQSRYQPVKLARYDLAPRTADLRRSVTFADNKARQSTAGTSTHRAFCNFGGGTAQGLGTTTDVFVLDPFTGCGTTNLTCRQNVVPSIGLELSP